MKTRLLRRYKDKARDVEAAKDTLQRQTFLLEAKSIELKAKEKVLQEEDKMLADQAKWIEGLTRPLRASSPRHAGKGRRSQVRPSRTLRQKFPALSSSQVFRRLKRLGVHGLVKKMGRSFKSYATSFGKQVRAMVLKLKHLALIPQLADLLPETESVSDPRQKFSAIKSNQFEDQRPRMAVNNVGIPDG